MVIGRIVSDTFHSAFLYPATGDAQKMKNLSLKYIVLAVLSALLFALPAQAENYWHQPMDGAWQMSGAGGGGFLLGLELGSDHEKINFYKAFERADVGAFFSYKIDMMDWTNNPGYGYGHYDFDGIQVGANLRFRLLENEKWNLMLGVDPGFDMYWNDRSHVDCKLFGLMVDLKLIAGIKIVDRFRVHAGIVIPFEILFASAGDDKLDEDYNGDSYMPWVSMPILLNGGAEFKILPWLSVMADIRLGPGIKFGNMVDANHAEDADDEDDLDSGAWFEWQTHVGVAFRF